ncbi:MFS transporter [Geothermobacter hydrogeniphilus]|uniref:MFS transporter n=1 Tax=Geothermobacter hydrogeniphilus TaxID=1969733 RepID=A0A2K2HBB2_9BACT|nr:MFS transporter [Geothermobacter hydrogeniphilus]PNU20513.1 MFS transporter [Geothermobacter hydrogeniphilus]
MANKLQGSGHQCLPGTVWALGCVSLCMDISSEIIHSLLPVFLVSVLGAGVQTVGLIEGVAESTAMVVRVFSGALSDRLGKRKLLAVCGYGLGALSKPLFALAAGVGMVFSARFIDRIGKGICGAPRDALVADVTPPEQRGAAYGLRQSLDSVGAFAGPLLAMLLMGMSGGSFRLIFWLAFLPGLLAVLILLLGVREPRSAPEHRSWLLNRQQLQALGGDYWRVLLVGTLFTMARFSEAFLLLRGTDLGLSVTLVSMVMVVMNSAYMLSAYPLGTLGDRIGLRGLLTAGMLVLVGADLCLALAGHLWLVLLGALLWGLHLGMTQGLLATLVAQASPPSLRGTAFGVFGLATGIGLLFASLLAGRLWQSLTPAAAFYGSALLALVALAGFTACGAGRRVSV